MLIFDKNILIKFNLRSFEHKNSTYVSEFEYLIFVIMEAN